MRRLTKLIVAAVLAAGGASAGADTAEAQIVVEANGARADGRWGGELGLGYRIAFGGFAITPAAGGFIVRGDNDRYYRDEFANGDSRCRDSQTGQFAEDHKCLNVAVRAYGRIEATYRLPGARLELGGGVRAGDEFLPYGTIALPLGAAGQFKVNAGPDYVAAGFRIGF